MDAPSIFSSAKYASAGVRSNQSCNSSALNTLSKLIKRSRCSISENLELPAADAQTPARLAPGKEHQNQRQELLVARCSRARDDVALLGQVLPNVFVLLPGLAGQMIQ